MQFGLSKNGILALAERARKYETPRTVAAKNAMGRLQVALDGVLSKHAANTSRTELSAEGKQAENRKGLRDAFAEIHRSTATATALTAKLNSRELRNRTLPASDKSDLVGAVKRSEDRAVLRSLPPGDRLGAALTDPGVLASALEGTDLASGLTREMRKALTDHSVASDPDRAKAVAEIEVDREAVVHLTQSIHFLRGAVGTSGGFASAVEFATAMKTAIGDRAPEIAAQAARAVDGSMAV